MFYIIFLVLGIRCFAHNACTTTSGAQYRPQCSSKPMGYKSSPTYRFSQFSYPQTETVQYATPAPSLKPTSYGLPYSSVQKLFANVSTTSWGNWDPKAPPAAKDTNNPYGQASWSAMWRNYNLANFTVSSLYSTTVSPTPIPSSELILPPPLYFGPTDCYNFPKDFILGAAGAAAQVEGAIAQEGRGPASPDLELSVAAASPFYAQFLGVSQIDPDYVTTENYYLYKQDITRLAAIGLKYYSFTIPWTRILPFTYPGTPVNSRGLQHYDDLINFAISKGIRPIVTLLHSDIPAVFYGNNSQSYLKAYGEARAYYSYTNGGYQYPKFVDAFVNYGKIVMSHFADRVPIWVTINEPGSGAVDGVAIDNIIKSHAQLWHFYHETLKGTGKVTMKMSGLPGIPLDPNNATHLAATQHFNDLNMGPFLNPLALGKDYPEAYKMTIQNFVPLSTSDLSYLNGTMDIVSADLYTASLVYPFATSILTCAADNSTKNSFYPSCVGTTEITASGWNSGFHSDYFSFSTPTYFRTQLNYLWNTYKRPVLVSEFGYSINSGSFPGSADSLQDLRFDVLRSEYYLSYFGEMLKAIWEDGVEVVGALMWSWVDNWEWGTFTHEFGLQWNNRTTQERSYRRSFFDVVEFVEGRREG